MESDDLYEQFMGTETVPDAARLPVVFGAENCIQCKTTTKHLDKAGVPFVYLDTGANDDAADFLRDRGFKQLPVVITPTDYWTGFRPDKLSLLMKG